MNPESDPPFHAAQRRQLREDLRMRRRALSAAARVSAAERLADRLLDLPFAPRSGHVAGYWANDGEIDLHPWQLRLPATCTYCLPVLGEDRRLRFAPWRPDAPLVPNRFGIPEPDIPTSALLDAVDMALVILPLVGFGATGQRLGMGGGWYDRSLEFRRDRPGPPWLVGAAFELQRCDTLEAEPWDVPLDAVCTESATHDFRTGT
ncbi:5-formyltetrahydrofolate cyclo-ligase [Marilutibacter alkalisoli]|uniref:5-formyltetrahydrofolate cyclo-ligase n=1 Tax=Marilutibacter alkalisoli TaxID=2591633 RepID=A0A514BP29_9GAMM|nr:5-formyltetrahydrofolate cyclo-ligase [Lysobacter alkalisoli]QDH69144.1 5-formyltetrahydrofolate cyclo-ligase [Lysobacter alkalisoli]